MAQKRIQYVKTSTGLVKQLIASAADIVEIDPISGMNAKNVQEAIEELQDIAAQGGVTSVNGKTGAVTLDKEDVGLDDVTNDAQVKRSEMGVANGVATLDMTGKVPAAQLPSYVDDVLNYSNKSGFPSSGETGKIYVAEDTNKTYRWSGTAYVEISESLALGETSSTAYAGDKGKKNTEDIAKINTDVDNIKKGSTKVGASESADKLASPRSIAVSGDAAGSAAFDGSKDVSIAVQLKDSGVIAGTYSVVHVDAKGRVTKGNQLIEWGESRQITPSTDLAIGGIFFELFE